MAQAQAGSFISLCLQDKAKGMDAYPSSNTLYIMYSTISKHNASLQQQMNCEQVPIKYSRGQDIGPAPNNTETDSAMSGIAEEQNTGKWYNTGKQQNSRVEHRSINIITGNYPNSRTMTQYLIG